jgi:hypothetical protein
MNISIDEITQWQDHFKAQHREKVSIKAYCRAHKLKPHRFYYWFKRLKEKTSKTDLIPVRVSRAPVNELPQATSTLLCTVELSGRLLKIYDLQALTVVLEMVH